MMKITRMVIICWRKALTYSEEVIGLMLLRVSCQYILIYVYIYLCYNGESK